jgi:hypothetical protein
MLWLFPKECSVWTDVLFDRDGLKKNMSVKALCIMKIGEQSKTHSNFFLIRTIRIQINYFILFLVK